MDCQGGGSPMLLNLFKSVNEDLYDVVYKSVPLPRPMVGMFTVIGFTCASGTDLSMYLGDGMVGWRGLWRTLGSQSRISGSSFGRSVTISKKLHQVGDTYMQLYMNKHHYCLCITTAKYRTTWC